MNGKKLFALALTALVSMCAIFAQGSYVVTKVTGSAKYEEKAGVQKKIAVGQTLSASTKVDIGPTGSLTLEIDGEVVTVKANSKDVLEKVIVKKTTTISKSNTSTAKAVNADKGTGKSVSTASTRAADAQKDQDWVD